MHSNPSVPQKVNQYYQMMTNSFISAFTFFLCILFLYFSYLQTFERELSQKSFGAGKKEEKAACDTASVTQINQIKEFQHSTAESHIIAEAETQVGCVVMLISSAALRRAAFLFHCCPNDSFQPPGKERF